MIILKKQCDRGASRIGHVSVLNNKFSLLNVETLSMKQENYIWPNFDHDSTERNS